MSVSTEVYKMKQNRVGEEFHQPKCRFCNHKLTHSVVDLGTSPLCQKHVKQADLNQMERFYPLQAYVCEQCWLVQLEEFATADDIFDDEYAYFSSFSSSWLTHCKSYTDLMQERFGLNSNSFVTEIASNDGYLLQYFVEKGIPVLGVEPTANTAEAAIQKGVPTEVVFFGEATAQKLIQQYRKADLLLGNNVLAHVPDLNDFIKGIKIMLADQGVLTMEFPHLHQLIHQNQFDTIYHEHFSYFSLTSVCKIFAHHGITLFDVDQLPTHGGSLRIYGRHTEDHSKPISDNIYQLLNDEEKWGMTTLDYYAAFEERVKETKRSLLEFLITQKRKGKQIVGYGAPGKGNTLLNYCGIRTDFLDYTVDRNPHKQGNFLPGTHIPILHPDTIQQTKPDYILILPWNLKDEITEQLAFAKEWGAKFVIPIPTVQIMN